MSAYTPEELKAIQSFELDALEVLMGVCNRLNIEYFADGGTALGAVRHGGFIPWDDVIDIAMKRADYNRLADAIKELDCGLSFIRPEDNPDTIYSYGKVCDKRTLVKESSFLAVEGYGAFVDVFPFDYLPENSLSRSLTKLKYSLLQKLIVRASRTSIPRKGIAKKAAYIASRPFDVVRLVQYVNSKYVGFNNRPTGYLGIAWDCLYPSDWFSGYSEVQFEGRELMTFRDPGAVLARDYGDYMSLPPESERLAKHGLICYARN